MSPQDLYKIIDAFRQERMPLSISPERLGVILRNIVDLFGDSDIFIRKDRDDRTPFSLTVGGDLKTEKETRSKDFNPGLLNGGLGWLIDKLGNAEFESARIRSALQVAELQVNRMSSIAGDQAFTDGDTIEEVTENSDGTFTLRLKEEWEGYVTSQYENNVIRGIYNDITNQVSGTGTTTINGATFFTSWMLVLSVDAPANTIRVSVYDDKDVPAGRNFTPRRLMKISRWGNAGSSSVDAYAQRQDCFYISSTEGTFLMLQHVTKPIIDKGNIALLLGKCPQFLADQNIDIKPGDIVNYTKFGLFERIVRTDYLGRPVATEVYRGEWKAGERYYDGSVMVEDSLGGPCYERSVVQRYGCLWLCNASGTEKAPMFGGTAWAFYQGIDVMQLQFATSQDSVWVDKPGIDLAVVCTIGNHDFTNDGAVRYDWSRQSWHGETENAASDSVWNNSHKNIGPSLSMEADDLAFSFGNPPSRIIVTVTATLMDAEGKPVVASEGEQVKASAQFDISAD